MLYERSFSIERRLQKVLALVRCGRYSPPAIAENLGVSVPTVSRDVMALRERGHDIRAKRHGESWRYVLARTETAERPNRSGGRIQGTVTA